MMQEAPATPRRKSASSDELDYADANKYDDLEEAQALLDAESGEKTKKKAPPRNLFGFYLHSGPPRSEGPPRPRAAPPAVGDRVVLRLDDVEGVVTARGRPGWFMVDLDGYDSSIEFEASELRVLAAADAAADASDSESDDGDDDRPITELSGNAPPGRFDQFAFREAVPESVGAMRSLISSAGLSSADCVEKRNE